MADKLKRLLSEDIMKEKAHQENEAFKAADYIRRVFMQTPALLCTLRGPDHVFELANEKLVELLKNRPLIGLPVREALPEMKGQGVFEVLDEVYKKGQPFTGEAIPITITDTDGNQELGYFDIVCQPSFDSDKNIDGILAHGINVSPQVKARKRIEQSETQFRNLVNNINNLAWMADGEGKVYWYNQQWYEYTGMTPEDINTLDRKKLLHPDHVERITEFSKHVWKKNKPFELTFQLRRFDGEFRWFLSRGNPFTNEKGEVVRWMGTNTDITEQKEAEDRFRNAADQAPTLIWMTGNDMQCNFLNKGWLKYTGKSLEEELGEGWRNGVHPDDRDKSKQACKHHFHNREQFQIEYRLLRHDGTYRWISDNGAPRYNSEGKFEGYIGICTDIQEQKHFAEELEKQVEERTKKLKQTNEALKISEERYYRMIEGVQDYAIISLDPGGIIQNWNKGAEKIKGYKAEEIVGKNFRIFYTKEDQVLNLPEKLLNEARTEGTAQHEGWRMRKDGSVFWGFIVITALKDDDDNIVGYSKVTRNLTDKKLAEDKIKEANNHLLNKTNQLIEAQHLAHMGSWEWDVLENNVEWSDELYRIFGLLPKQSGFDYDSYLNHIHPDDRDHMNEVVQKAFKDQLPYEVNHRIIREDGSIRIVSSTGKVYTDEEGRTVRFAGTAQDVTDQKKYESELKESEERFLKIFHSNPVPMTLTEHGTSKIKFVNNQFLQKFGLTESEVIGNKSADLELMSPEENARLTKVIMEALQESRSIEELQALTADETEEILQKLKQTGIMNNFEVMYSPKNSKPFSALIFYETLKIRDKGYTITSYQDITERKKAEEQLKKQNEEFEKMNKELQSFAYISSHDLQEPLRKIQTFVSRILDKEFDNLSEKGKGHFNQILYAAQRMQQLILDLLAYSRTTSEQLDLTHTDLNEIVNEVKDDLKEILLQTKATIVSKELCHCNIIPFQFRQLLNNLISNSLKFASPGIPPEITIISRIIKGSKIKTDNMSADEINKKIFSDKDYCHLRVTDNGIGFEQQYSSKIFEVFQRLHGKEQYSGTGIGLAIVKKIVDNHNGIITAQGALNAGARFDIYFPE